MPTLGDRIKKIGITFSKTKRLAKKLERNQGAIEKIEDTLVGHELSSIEGTLRYINQTLEREIKAS
jgi:predicted transcriptional regulator